MNSYPSLLQTTSYNFSATQTTGELCVGVVKGSGVYPKNPAQHASEFEKLEEIEAVRPAFLQPKTNDHKVIKCIKVNGATDEGPSHLEVQFWWTLHHLRKPTFATLVTA